MNGSDVVKPFAACFTKFIGKGTAYLEPCVIVIGNVYMMGKEVLDVAVNIISGTVAII